MLVTAKNWYMAKRVYGKVVGSNKRYVFVQGKFGLEQFHRSSIRVVRSNKRLQSDALPVSPLFERKGDHHG
jgi:IS4 transposase